MFKLETILKHNNSSFPQQKKNNFFKPTIQKKLSIGSANDSYEVEADNMANRVMRMSNPQQQNVSQTGALVQRKCAACEEEEKIQKKDETITPLIQRSSNSESGGQAPGHIESQINSSRGSGSSMDNGTKHFMESRFGTDFSDVKIHTGSQAVQMSRELNAQAFTVGSDIYFNEGKYSPDSDSGKHLLAHELTHTVQQSGGIGRKVQRTCSDPAKTSTAKQANIQIFVISDDDGKNPTKATSMIGVDKIWEKCCIHMNVLPIKTIKKTDYKSLDSHTSSNGTTAEEQDLVSNNVANAVNVFFVKTFKDTTSGVESKNHYGGGYTLGGGGSSPYTFIVEGALASVVAHEIGHGLGQSNHIAGTVMEGSGAYNAANPETVSGPLCSKVHSWSHLKDISSKSVECCHRY